MGPPQGKAEAAIRLSTPCGPNGRVARRPPAQSLSHSPALLSTSALRVPSLPPACRGVMCQDSQNMVLQSPGVLPGTTSLPFPQSTGSNQSVWFLWGTLRGVVAICVSFFGGLAELGSRSQHATPGCVQRQGPIQDWEPISSPAVAAELSRWLEEPR